MKCLKTIHDLLNIYPIRLLAKYSGIFQHPSVSSIFFYAPNNFFVLRRKQKAKTFTQVCRLYEHLPVFIQRLEFRPLEETDGEVEQPKCVPQKDIKGTISPNIRTEVRVGPFGRRPASCQTSCVPQTDTIGTISSSIRTEVTVWPFGRDKPQAGRSKYVLYEHQRINLGRFPYRRHSLNFGGNKQEARLQRNDLSQYPHRARVWRKLPVKFYPDPYLLPSNNHR